jgi:ABC-type phosphate transport system substrate-binding protein
LHSNAKYKNVKSNHYHIPGSIGTKGAIKAVTDGAITLGLISRSLEEEEKNLGIVEHPSACVAIIVGAHSNVQDDTITTQEFN